MGLIDAYGDLLEIEARGRGRALRLRMRDGRKRKGSHGGGDRGDAERALDQVAAVKADSDHIADGRGGAGIPTDVLRGVISLETGERTLRHSYLIESA